MFDMNELFENNCFSMGWTEAGEPHAGQKQAYVVQRKDLQTLLAELEDIKNTIKEAEAREWHLARLLKYHNEGFSR